MFFQSILGVRRCIEANLSSTSWTTVSLLTFLFLLPLWPEFWVRESAWTEAMLHICKTLNSGLGGRICPSQCSFATTLLFRGRRTDPRSARGRVRLAHLDQADEYPPANTVIGTRRKARQDLIPVHPSSLSRLGTGDEIL